MIVYRIGRPIIVKGKSLADYLLTKHRISEPGQRSWKTCYHYEVDDDVGRDLIARGLATELTTPFACRREGLTGKDE